MLGVLKDGSSNYNSVTLMHIKIYLKEYAPLEQICSKYLKKEELTTCCLVLLLSMFQEPGPHSWMAKMFPEQQIALCSKRWGLK